VCRVDSDGIKGGHLAPLAKKREMARADHTRRLALTEEGIIVLFCLVDDAYALLNPHVARRYESLKRLSDSEIIALALFQQPRGVESSARSCETLTAPCSRVDTERIRRCIMLTRKTHLGRRWKPLPAGHTNSGLFISGSLYGTARFGSSL
jgi:hypothetical protein